MRHHKVDSPKPATVDPVQPTEVKSKMREMEPQLPLTDRQSWKNLFPKNKLGAQ
ncbi:hypothetical protein HAX54_004206, partial [Datura stramonium]|nr:hypothetical protein [Datura stramonium]